MIDKNLKKKVVFLDRDGVINHDYGYVYQANKFHFIDGVFKACKHFINLGYEIIVISNQSGIGRNFFKEEDFLNLTKWMIDRFKENKIDILKVYYCSHHPNKNCTCRKPQIGMIQQSLDDYDIDLEKSWLIGDKMTDIQTAINSNIKNYILINSEKKDSIITANNLVDTIKIITK